MHGRLPRGGLDVSRAHRPILTFPRSVRRDARDPAPRDSHHSREFRLWRARQSDRYGDSGLTREQEGDYRKAPTAVALLREFAKPNSNSSWRWSSARPHTPLICPQSYLKLYDLAKIPMPLALPDKLVNFPI